MTIDTDAHVRKGGLLQQATGLLACDAEDFMMAVIARRCHGLIYPTTFWHICDRDGPENWRLT